MFNDLNGVVLAASGVTALLAAGIWRATAHSRRRQELAAGPASRRTGRPHGGSTRSSSPWASNGRHPTLLAHVPDETDNAARAAIALAVMQRQWEPSGSARMHDLRAWAGSELDPQGSVVAPFPGPFTRISDMGGPRAQEARNVQRRSGLPS